MLDACIVPVMQLFTDNEIHSGSPQKMYADYYRKNWLESVNQLLGTIRGIVYFWEPGQLNIIEEHGTIEKECTIL